MATSPFVLVGRRLDNGQRDRLWAYARRFWSSAHMPIAAGFHNDGPFNLAAAMNIARRATDESSCPSWDVAVVAGADAVPGDLRQVEEACELALESGRLVFPHDHYYSLSREGTEQVLAGEPPHGRLAEWPAWTNTFSTLFVVPRSLWDEVGGWDERFQGWGHEDFAFWSACWALAGGFERVTGPVFHLWHERVPAERDGHPGYAANRALGERYMAARTSREEMLAILREPGAPLGGRV